MYDKNERAAFIAEGQALYEKLKSELQPGHEGEIAAIHPPSGNHFVGKTLNEADEKAFSEYPDQWLYFIRIGSPESALPLKTW